MIYLCQKTRPSLKMNLDLIKTFIIQQVHKLQGHRHHHVLDSDTMDDEEEDEEELTRDEFNLNKMIILVTAAGKIFGIKSTNGRPEWQLFLPELSPFKRYGKEKLFLFVQRTTAHFPNPPQCTVLGRNKRTGEGHIFSFNPITGKPIKGMPPTGIKLNYNVLQVSMLGKMDENFLKGIILLDENFKMYTFPESFRKVIEEDTSSIFMFVADISTGIITGFKTESKNKELVSNKVWTVNLQKKQQTITGIYGKRAVEHVHSQGRVLGDRSVLYKYLNPNLIVVVTEGEDTTSSSQKGPGNFISIYLIDSVTGHMVFHCSHKRSKGPVNVIHSENWVVYNYFNQKSRRYEIAVLELFEGKDQSNATAFSSFSAPREPLVLRQSYIMPLAISTMATTITEKGITSKNIIFALKLGGLLSLPKALLDPRRPIIPTQETMEEGTIPYIPELPVSTEAVINYNQSVYNVRDIQTSPAGLESTSLVLSYGLDLFFTRVTPSKMFDVLKEDFDYYFISLVLGGMFAVSFISQKLAGRKALTRAWK
ncbi:hypothetical protein KUTeg_002012 [Tegillarca granosa]|uniref:ER membrane protein complex subunit 1 n=1 Tax=Tegillarca granosa TaxID=220873 RepID=A0ABQ9FVV7_TEGGR|nr:hypothetical protein KUTeg_002012 [Tegillarca granosa]